jgi:peptidoglycan/LPS O-acetylase OafA/YrhL
MVPDRRLSGGTARYSSLDAWRGVVCLLIIGYHSSLVYVSLAGPPEGAFAVSADALLRAATFGNVRVPLFFVISGYCIAAAAEVVRQRRRSVSQYFIRRFHRIYPVYWAVVLASIAFFVLVDVAWWPRLLSSEPWSQPRPWWYSSWQWVGNLTLTETWREHVIGGPRGHFPGQAWTLCYEEQFYAVVGVLLVVSRRYFFAGVSAVSLFTVAVAFVGSAVGWPIAGFFFDGTWLTFASGVLVYWVSTYAPHSRARLASSALLLGAAAATPWMPIPGGTEAFAFSTLLVWLHPFDERITAHPVSKPLGWCGQMCYSLYLVHQLIVKAVSKALWNLGLESAVGTLLVTLPLCFAASIVAGRACYLAIERYFVNQPAPVLGCPRWL